MTELLLANSTRTATIGAPADRVDLTEWLFTLRDDEYQQCSRAHIAGGASRTRDGKRMSINVEQPGDTLLVQHYVEDLTTRGRCRVTSQTDGFGPLGRIRYRVVWEVSVAPNGPSACTFTNHVEVYATEELQQLFQKHGVPFEAASEAAQRTVDEHNTEEAPLFAKNVEAKAREGVWGTGR
jgi:hypothetical protein